MREMSARPRRDAAATVVEYALILGMVAVLCAFGFSVLSHGTRDVRDRLAMRVGPTDGQGYVGGSLTWPDAPFDGMPLPPPDDERCKLSIVPMVARNAADWNEWTSAYEEAQDMHCHIAHSYLHWADIELDNGVFDWDSPGYYVSLAKGHGMEVSQEITVINVMDIGNLPADLAGRGLDDATLQQRFLSFVEQYAEHFKDDVSYLWLGNEIDTYLHYNPDKVPTFVNLLTQAVAIVREHAPEMKVGTVMTYHGAVMTGRTGWIHTFGPLVDIMAVTFYPQHMPGRYDEATIDQQFDDIVATYGDYPLALVESAVSAEAVYGGGEDKQVSYCRALFRAMRRHKDVFDFAGWFNLHDFDPAYLEMLFGGWGISDPDVLAWNGSLALSSFQDEEKPVHAVWAEEAGGSIVPSDNQAPAVAWVSPASGGDLSGWVTLRAEVRDAEDAAGETTVQWRLDDGGWTAVSYDAGTGRYERGWNADLAPAGSHALAVRATDTGGKTASSTITVTIAGDTGELPSVAWVSPKDGQVVLGDVTLQLAATGGSDAQGALNVQWSVPDLDWYTAPYNARTGHYEFTLSTARIADGPCTLSAKATDGDGRSGIATVQVAVANAAPGVARAMYVYDVSFRQEGTRLITTVTVRHDSDENGVAQLSDAVVQGATVQFRFTLDSDRDGVFEPGGDDQQMVLDRETGADGTARVSFRQALVGNYRVEITRLGHDGLTHDIPLDVKNPAYYRVSR